MKLNKLTTVLFGIFMFILFVMFNFHIEYDNGNSTNSFGVEASVSTKTVSAQSGCTFTCLNGLESCSGPNCSNRWVCEGACSCSFEWVKFGDYTTGKCDTSNGGGGGGGECPHCEIPT